MRRTFTDTQTTANGSIQVFASAGATGDLSLRRIELSFDNNARTSVIKKGEEIRAIADVSFNSNGLLKGEWRIMEPGNSTGVVNGRGRVLQVIRQQLVSSGQGRKKIISPVLPSKTNGLHIVSFVATDTTDSIPFPVIRYYVLDGTIHEIPESLTVNMPADNVIIRTDTVFTWKMIDGAAAYRLEIYHPGEDDPISGKAVPSTDLKLSLASPSLEKLSSGHIYDWRIRAYNADGVPVAQSALKSLYMP